MKNLIPQAGWLVGGALLLASGIHCQSNNTFNISPQLNETSPNCSVDAIYYGSDKYGYDLGVYIIRNQADVDGLLGCITIRAHIEVEQCSPELSEITLKDLQTIEGRLVVSDCDHLQNFSAPALQSLGYYMEFLSLPILTEVHFPLLRSPGRSLLLEDTPLLSTVTASLNTPFNASVNIINTSLSNLDFLYAENATEERPGGPLFSSDFIDSYDYGRTQFFIFDNPHLEWIKGPAYKYSNVTIQNNGLSTSIDFPNLENCSHFYVSSTTNLNIPSLVNVEGLFSIVNNSMVDLSLPRLQAIGQDLTIANNTRLQFFNSSVSKIGSSYPSDVLISGNPALQSISLPKVTAIDGIIISSNPVLQTINFQEVTDIGYQTIIQNNPALSSINLDHLSTFFRTMNISGNFSSLAFPAATQYILYYPFYINSTNPEFDCSAFDKEYYSYPYFSDNYYGCGAYVAGSTKDTAKHWHPPKKGLKRPGIQAAIAISSIVVGIFVAGLIWRHRRREKRRDAEQAAAVALADLPPTYARVPKPHEVPPVYGRHAPAGSEGGSSTEVNTAVATPTVPAENVAAEQTSSTQSHAEHNTVSGVPTPPEYVEHDAGRETRRSEEVPTGALPSGPASQPARE